MFVQWARTWTRQMAGGGKREASLGSLRQHLISLNDSNTLSCTLAIHTIGRKKVGWQKHPIGWVCVCVCECVHVLRFDDNQLALLWSIYLFIWLHFHWLPFDLFVEICQTISFAKNLIWQTWCKKQKKHFYLATNLIDWGSYTILLFPYSFPLIICITLSFLCTLSGRSVVSNVANKLPIRISGPPRNTQNLSAHGPRVCMCNPRPCR